MYSMQKIIVKVGTSTLTQGGQKLSRRFMLGLVEQFICLMNQGKQVVIVSSGAVAAGREVLDDQASKPLCASIGQVKLMQTWAELFGLFDLYVGQVLLTRDDFCESDRVLRIRDTVMGLLHHGIVPVVNENDTVATENSRVGDNDNLAAHVAGVIEADTVIILTDQEGLYTADPRIQPDAQLIPTVQHIDEAIFALARGSSSAQGTGGMTTKIEAAEIAARSGTRTIIASSARPNVLLDIIEGRPVGTLFLESQSKIIEE